MENINKNGTERNGVLMELVGIIIFFVIYFLITSATDVKFDNYTPPNGQKIDYNKQALDKVQHNLSNEQVKRNTINGKYNVRK